MSVWRRVWSRGLALVMAVCLLLSALPAPAKAAGETDGEGRVELSFNNDWRFHRGEVAGAEAPEFDDSGWLYVNAPHSTIQYTPENYYQKDLGIFWYRRHFETPDTVTGGRRALLTFEGAMQEATVWLNGTQLGAHQGGYTQFSFDLTDALKTDGTENVLAVKLDTSPNTSFAPGKVNPDFQYFGGLYRNVYLTITAPVHITDAVHSGTVGGGGVFITAPAVSAESASLTVKTEVENTGSAAAEVAVLTQVLDEDGVSVAAADTSSPQSVAAGSKVTVAQALTVTAPRLWSTNTPELYTIRSTVQLDGVDVDTVETTYGIRKVEWKRDGCYINDERVELVGTNLHSETYMLGNAMPDDAIFAEIKRLREYGFNFIRMSHYPHSPAFYDACDKYGVAVLDCLAGWQYFNNSGDFKDNTYQQMREQVRASRNNACVVAWEPSLNESGYDASWAAAINTVTKEEYPDNGVAKAWTGGWRQWSEFDLGVGTPQANVMRDAANNASKPVIVSEYGDWNMGGYNSTTRVTREPSHKVNQRGAVLGNGDAGMLTQSDNIQSSFAYNRKFDWFGADAYWQYADYAGFDTAVLTYCGVVDLARIPKFGAYFFQSQRDPAVDLSKYGLDSGPMAFIANTWASDSSDQVRVYSNCDQVALYLDDVLIATQTPDATMWDPRGAMADDACGSQPGASSGANVSTENIQHPPFTFDLSAYTPGQGTLRAVGLIDGEEAAAYTRRAPGAAAAIELVAEDNVPLKLDGSSAKLVWFNIVDENGTVVNTAENEVTFAVSGPGIVVGEKTVAARGGAWAVWVRGKRGSGDITLTATSNALTSATLILSTQTVDALPAVPEGGDADESEFVEPDPVVNLFLNKPATASSVNKEGQSNAERAEYANDDSITTKWCAAITNSNDHSVGPHWWQVDLGLASRVDSVEIVFDAYNAGTPYKYQIAVSNDPEFTDYDPAAHEDLSSTAETMTTEVGATGRYVRIYINCPSSSLWPCVKEIRGYGRAAENIALNKTATAIGSAGGSSPAGAVDGKVSETAGEFWNRGGNGPGWWQVDLGSDYHVDDVQVSFAWAQTSNNGVIRHKFTLQASMDGETWEDIETWSDLEQTNGQANATVSLSVNKDARHLKVADLEAKKETSLQAQWIEIAEFVATGTLLDPVRLDYEADASASSCSADAQPSMGNDGNPVTYWTPAATDTSPWWQFDAGGLYRARNVELHWASEGEHRYKLQTSTDGVTWTDGPDHLTAGVSGSTTSDLLNAPLARYIRVCVPQGTTAGFWVNTQGYEQTPALSFSALNGELSPVRGEVGDLFEELALPDAVAVTLSGDVVTTLPVVWSSADYDATSTDEQTLTGVLHAIPGIALPENTTASVRVTLRQTARSASPRIDVQPTAQTVQEGESVTFSVTATSPDGGTLSYRWQRSTDGGGFWSNVENGDQASCTVPSVSLEDDGAVFRCVVTNTKGAIPATSVNSQKAELTVTGVSREDICTVTFARNNGAADIVVEVRRGNAVEQPADPVRAGYLFTGWFNGGSSVPYDFTTPVTVDLTLTAHWKQAQSSTGAPVSTPTVDEGTPITIINTPESGDTAAETVVKPAVDVTEGTAAVGLTPNDGGKIVAEAAENHSKRVIIEPEAAEETDRVELSLPALILKGLAEETDAELVIAIPGAEVVVPRETLAQLAAYGGNLKVAIACDGDTVAVDITRDGKAITGKGRFLLGVPTPDAGVGTVMVLANGTRQVLRDSLLEEGVLWASLDGSAQVTILDNSRWFIDVPRSHWAEEYIRFVSSRELFQGTSDDEFSPNAVMDRAMLVTVLYRLANEPEAGKTSFADVPADTWYTRAVAWASEQGIAEGTGVGFAPEQPITREALAVLLYRYADPESDAGNSLSGYADADAVSSWALQAMRWAVETGIINGKDGLRLDPLGSATRAEAAAMLARFCTLR